MFLFSFITSIIGLALTIIFHIFMIIGIILGYDSSIVSNVNLVLWVILFISILPLSKERKFNFELMEKIKKEDKLWLYVLSILIPVYCFAVLALSIILNKHGSPEILNGQYVLANRSEVIEIITKGEYNKQIYYYYMGFASMELFAYSCILIESYFKMHDETAMD